MSPAPLHSVSVAAAVLDPQGRVLAIRRRDNGHWEPPGGVLELEESIHDGLRREVKEETGLRVEPDALTGVYKNMNRGIVALVFRCHLAGGTEQTSVETDRVAWLTPDQIRDRMSEAYAIRLLDALPTEEPRPAIRSHDGERVTN
ncbi:NUDIX hydrolase [Actinopolymorpha singaporensis]|uniref:ADP-ribose pyrophosphatase YjhB, NUDIX family n=1 Tax=Actinopolymorpha singaporensis TaxID=117157 RepID=A0A1H1M6B9_9ACTN|nr:NUDIX domain-containing protein [Actinopolymorpha singaporensis]SDR82062.1 ADP-ribose pyrophosphatase YjhB, NUDIX family [Actinopolymorpha singaporensis]